MFSISVELALEVLFDKLNGVRSQKRLVARRGDDLGKHRVINGTPEDIAEDLKRQREVSR